MADSISESELFLLGALSAKADVRETAATSNEVAIGTANEPAVMAAAERAEEVLPVEPLATTAHPTTNTNATDIATTPDAGHVATPGPPLSQEWAPKNRNLSDAVDPLVCPGLNNDCFHATVSDGGYWGHVARVHHYTRKQMDKPENEWVRDIFLPARRASWFMNRGVDITYRGSEPKQVAARKRWALGIKTTDPGYAKSVYGSTFTKPDV